MEVADPEETLVPQCGKSQWVEEAWTWICGLSETVPPCSFVCSGSGRKLVSGRSGRTRPVYPHCQLPANIWEFVPVGLGWVGVALWLAHLLKMEPSVAQDWDDHAIAGDGWEGGAAGDGWEGEAAGDGWVGGAACSGMVVVDQSGLI